MTEPTQASHSNHPPMLNREQPAPFIIVGHTPGGALTIPTTSARGQRRPYAAPGKHMRPQLRRPPLASRSHQGDST